MRSRDVGILIVCGVAILMSLEQEGVFHMSQTWVKPIDTGFFANQHYPLESERLPNPIVTDLDGDGVVEIVVATRDPHIQILDPATPSDALPGATGKHVQRLNVKAEASLLSSVKIAAGRQPVAMATGYLDKLPEGEDAASSGPRHQVIVVVTQGWTVLCFDHNLNLIWESTVPEDLPDFFYQREVAIAITPYPVYEGDRGSVVVGGRLDSEETLDTTIDHDHQQPEVEDVYALDDDDQQPDAKFHDNIEAEGGEVERHFNYYSFEGRTGAMRWHHQANDFHEPADGDSMFPIHNYRREIKSRLHHTGEVNWRQFREDVLAALPHRWVSREDTKFTLAHFERTRVNKAKDTDDGSDKHHAEVAGLDKHLEGLSFDILSGTPHVESDHIHKPNVIVAALESGLEIVHLYTGRTITQLTMAKGTYADINDDGIIEHLEAVISESGEENNPAGRLRSWRGRNLLNPSCYGRAEAGVPPIEQLFNGSICRSGAFSLRGVSKESGSIRAVDPIVVPHHNTRTHSHSDKFDSIFFTSAGLLTSLSPEGDINWQLRTGCRWSPDADELSTVPSATMLDLLKEGAMPILTSAALEEGEDWEYIIVGGHERVSIVGLDGSSLGKMRLPDVPVNPVVVADFNGDGWKDLIITTRNGHHGIAITPNAANQFLPVLVGLLLCAMGAAHVLSRIAEPVSTSRSASRKRIN